MTLVELQALAKDWECPVCRQADCVLALRKEGNLD